MKKATAILMADVHLMDRVPVCRTDDFMKAQTKKLQFISDLQKEHSCPVLVAGDIFDKAKSSPYLQALAIKKLPDNMIAVPGNHCLPSHSLELYEKSSMYVLEVAGKLISILDSDHALECEEFIVTGFPFSVPFKDYSAGVFSGKKVALVHGMVYKTKPIHEEVGGSKAINMLKKSSYDLIVTGDNHQSFMVEHEGRILVNCGSIMRTTAAQIDHKPAVYLWHADTNEVETVYLPIEGGVVSREHIETKELRDERIASFVERIDHTYEVGSSFVNNIKKFFGKNRTRQGVIDRVYGSFE